MTVEPLSLAEAKQHLRVEDDDPYLTYLAGYITAARQTVEEYLNASVANQTRVHRLDAFPAGAIVLPNGPVISVTSIAYVDVNGANQTVAAHLRLFDTITPVYGAVWPSTRDQLGAVTITYQAGMMAGSPLTLEREDIKSGIKLTLGDIWEHREGMILGAPIAVNPTVERLLHFHRRTLGV